MQRFVFIVCSINQYSKKFSNILECTTDEHCIDDPTGDTCKEGKCVCGLCGCKCDKPAICIDGKCQLPPTGMWWPQYKNSLI